MSARKDRRVSFADNAPTREPLLPPAHAALDAQFRQVGPAAAKSDRYALTLRAGSSNWC